MDTGAINSGQEVWVLRDWTDGSAELRPGQDSTGLCLRPTARASPGLTAAEAKRQLRAPRAEPMTQRAQSQL